MKILIELYGGKTLELRPRHTIVKKANVTASREFTDREEPTKAFLNAFRDKIRDQYKVLTYYGVGGIGKSRLISELYKKVEVIAPGAVKVIIDFKEEKHRHVGEALISLREELKKHENIKFNTFDLAYTVFWRKLHPQLSMKNKTNELPFIEEGTFIADLIEQLEYVPFAQWVPKTLKLINGMTRYKESFHWWHGRGKEVLEQLEQLQPSEIEEMLPAYFAVDLKEYLETSMKKAVIFLDTYEALWEKNRNLGSFYEKDSWVQELVLQLPEVLWVICGREKIQWAEAQPAWHPYLEQHLMGELSDKDSEKFLTACGIHNGEIRQVIIKSSKGLPYYLDLMVDTYSLIHEKRIPVPDDFSKTPQKILDRFLRYLDISEKETLKVLSFTRFWDEELFTAMVTGFNTGYPATAYLELFRFSFINHKPEERVWDMNQIMRTSIQEDIKKKDSNLFKRVHEFLFAYYDVKLKSTKRNGFSERDKQSAREAFYHGKKVMQASQFLSWFLITGKMLQAGGQFQLVSSFRDHVVKLLPEEDSEQAAAVYQYFGEIGLLQGSYEKAIEFYQKSLRIYSALYSSGNIMVLKGITKCCSDLAEIMIHTTEYEKAYDYLSEVAQYYLGHEDLDEELLLDQALLLIRLGKLNIRFSHYEESLKNYQDAIAACDRALLLKPENPAVFAMKALAFEKLGELYGSRQYALQGECYLKSIHFYDLALGHKDEINYLRILTNKGLAFKRLAEHYDVKKEPAEKLKSFEQAIMIYNQVLEQSPDFIDALEKKGHAAVDYMILQIELGQYDRTLETFTEAVAAFEKALDLSPKQGGSKNRIASAHRELAYMYMKKDQPDEALSHLQESLQIYGELLEQSNYIYVHNSLGKTHEMIGDYYIQYLESEKAKAHYKLAIEEFKRMLERAPKLREPIERIARIEKKY
jgi:tetratricopeptide (TPR) repeat protein